MTDRQFVRQYYPNATLDYYYMVLNTIAPRIYHRILQYPRFNGKPLIIIARGDGRNEAWRNAKKRIKEK